MPEVTIITVIKTPPLFRNREWLKKNLDSIKNQLIEVEGILVDYGSDKNELKWIRELVKEYKNIRLIEAKKDIKCNYGTAQNIGIKQVKTKYTAMMGADTRLKETAIRTCINKSRGNNLYLTGLAREVDSSGKAGGEDKKSDKGSFVFTNTEWLQKVHGFDERLKGWGCDDGDLYERAMRDGLKHEWLVNEVFVQWHEVKDRNLQSQEARSNSNLIENDKTIIRNLETWGKY